MKLTIEAQVTDKNNENRSITLTTLDIENLIEDKARRLKIRPFSGRIMDHYRAEVLSIQVED